MMNTSIAPTAAGDLVNTAAPRASKAFRVCLWLHRWTGLVSAPFFLVLCLTGSLLVFHNELQTLLGDVPTVTDYNPSDRLPATLMVQRAKAHYTDRVPLYVIADAHTPEITTVGMAPANDLTVGAAKPLFFHSGTAQLLQTKDLMNDTFMGFIFELHAQWLMGLPGQLFGGLIALLVLTSLVTGVMVYTPFVKRIVFGQIRSDKERVTSQLDWHNFIGVVVVGWLAVVTLTGAFLAIGSIAFNVWRMTELKDMTRAYIDKPPLAAAVDVDTAITAAAQLKPHTRFMGAVFPGSEFSGNHHFGVFTSGTKAWSAKVFEITLIDAATGLVTEARPTPWYLKVVMLSQPLHFGDYGGRPLQLFWLLATWLAMFITANGAWLWWAKRPKKQLRLRQRSTPQPLP